MKKLNTRVEYKIVGGDFSAQEPRLTAFYSQDENMIQAYVEGKDLYAVIGSKSFGVPYEDCLEFYPEGTKIMHDGKEVICGYKTHQNKEGKQRRSYSKSILLGVLYGRGAASVGEQIGKTRDEAQEIIDSFFKAFPKVYEWIEGSKKFAYENGYVEDVAGRRRRLDDILLPKYEVTDNLEKCEFNPIFGSSGKLTGTRKNKVDWYLRELNKCNYKRDVDNLKAKATSENFTVKDNGGFIAQAERQSVNARVQGGAATLTKVALITLYNDERLKNYDAHLVNTVHDEILLECPDYYSEQVASILTEDMVGSAKTIVYNVPMKTDTYDVPCWYLDEFFVTIENEFDKLLKKYDDLTAFDELVKNHKESRRSQLYEIVRNMMKEKPQDAEILDAAILKGEML